jgi:Tfp pilus assembly protein FimT
MPPGAGACACSAHFGRGVAIATTCQMHLCTSWGRGKALRETTQQVLLALVVLCPSLALPSTLDGIRLI